MADSTSTSSSGSPGSPVGGSTTLVIVAVVVAIAAVVLVNVYIELVRRQSQPDTIAVYRLDQKVRQGDQINDKLVRAYQVDARFSDAFGNSLDEVEVQNNIRDRKRFTRGAERGQVVTFDMLHQTQSQREEYEPREGFRDVALTVDSNDLPTLFEGMSVDVSAPFMIQGRTEWLAVIEGVKVKNIGDPARTEGEDGPVSRYKKVVLELTPEQALALVNIKGLATGDFVLFRRNPADRGTPLIQQQGLNPVLLDLIQKGGGGSGGGGGGAGG